MSFAFYKILHLFGAFLLLSSLGGLAATRLAGESAASGHPRKLLGALHGLGLLLLLVAGFGMMARLEIIAQWPVWIWIKLSVWLILGASVALLGRLKGWGRLTFLAFPLLALVAAYAAIFHLGA